MPTDSPVYWVHSHTKLPDSRLSNFADDIVLLSEDQCMLEVVINSLNFSAARSGSRFEPWNS